MLAINGYFSLTEIEDMLPWERDINISILLDFKEKQKKAREQQ
jgi:hypothetical protein